VAALVGALLVDTHDDLRDAWRRLVARKLPSDGVRELGRPPIGERDALQLAKSEWKEPAVRNRKKIEWQSWAEAKYRRIARN
jgi:hypothetical protein